MSIALARRYRPKRFADLLVQDHVTAVLRGAVARGRVGHGYLFSGPRGVGKTTAARILAMALNCPNRTPEGDPCGECESCRRIWTGSASLDVVEIDAASNRGVDDARDLRERAMYAASQPGGHKIYIVDEAHMLTREAWNALLKILEEPPPGVVFVFATTEPQKIAAAAAPVLSRLQRFDFRRIGPTPIRARLREVLDAEQIPADDDALTLIARHADGGMRDALSMLDQCLSFGEGRVTAERVREVLGLVDDEIFGEVLRLAVEHDAAAVFPLVERLVDSGADLAEFTGAAAEALRALLMLQVGATPEGMTEALRLALESCRDAIEPGDVLRMLKLLAESENAVRRSGNPRLVVETLLLRWALMDRVVDLQAALGAMGTGGGATGSATAGRRPAAPPSAGGPDALRDVARAAAAPAGPPLAASAASAAPAAPAAAVPPADPPLQVPFQADALRAAWREVVSAARREGPLLAQALGAASIVAVAPPRLTLAIDEASGLGMVFEAQRERLTALLERIVGERVQVELSAAAAPAEGAPRPQRITDAGARAERLKGLRAKDPALDIAASELDLEIVE